MDHGASIGAALRSRREERGLSPEQAAYQSRVPLRLVEVLESDDYRLVPDAFYMIRVLHDYARFLGLEPDGMERAFLSAIQRSAKPVTMAGPASPPMPSVSWRHVAWTGAAILAVVPLVFIALSLSAQRQPRPIPPHAAAPVRADAPAAVAEVKVEQPAESTAGEPAVKADLPAVTAGSPPPEPTVRVEQTAAALPASAPAPPGVERKPRRLQLVAEAVEETWMSVRSDGGERRQVLLRRGERARFGADTGFVVTVGNAGGVQLSLNGERLPVLGKSGEVVRNLALPRDDAAAGAPAAVGR